MSVDKSPVYEVKAVPVEKVYANDYNPNVVIMIRRPAAISWWTVTTAIRY